MKAKRLLFLVMAICLASGVKAQFYDGHSDIYFYITAKDDFNQNGPNEVTIPYKTYFPVAMLLVPLPWQIRLIWACAIF